MRNAPERILLVESDIDNIDQIAAQALQPLGYRVDSVKTANAAIQHAARLMPDAIIVNLNLPGLSGKDLLVALNSQGLEIPVLVIARKGQANDIIQAFRLGAADYLLWPAKEAEIVAVVERVLKQVRARREREQLSRQLNQTNQELQNRVRELTTIFAIGKAVTSITDQRKLLEKLLEGSAYVSEADRAWLLLRDDKSKTFHLRAQLNLPESVAQKLDQPWDDGLSSLVGLSGEPLAIHGEPLKRFKISHLGNSALVMPIKIKHDIVGLLVLVRKNQKPFSPSTQALLGAVTDYASISIINARLFQAVEERAQTMEQAAKKAQASEHSKDETLKKIKQDLRGPLSGATDTLSTLLIGEEARLNAVQKNLLRSVQSQLHQINQIIATLTTPVDVATKE